MPPSTQLERLARIETKLDQMLCDRREDHDWINGNGKEGAKTIIAKNELRLAALEELIKKTNEHVQMTNTTVNALAETMKLHIADHSAHKKTTWKDLIWNKGALAYIILGFIALHTLAEQVPVLWSIITKVFAGI